MLRLLLGKDWTENRKEILRRISADVHERKSGRILIVPELISHDMERRLCEAAGDTASRYAEVLSFTRLARRVADTMGNSAQECLDAGGRVVAMAASAQQLSSRLKAYAAVETKPEFLTELVDGVDEFKRCCITSADLISAAKNTDGSLAQKLEELALLMECYDNLCAGGKRDPRDQMTWLLEQLEEGTFGQEHVFYIDGFPDFTRQNLAIIHHLLQVSPCVTVSLNCDTIDSSLLAFEKAGQTASELYQLAQRAGVEVVVEYISADSGNLGRVCDRLFQGRTEPLPEKNLLHVYRCDSVWQECLSAAEEIRKKVISGIRYRDITLVCADMNAYQPLVDLIFHRFHIPVYCAGTEEILRKSVMDTVLAALNVISGGFDQKEVHRYLRSAMSPLDPDTCDLVENYSILWGIRGLKWTEPWDFHPKGLGEPWTQEAHRDLSLINDAKDVVIPPLHRMYQRFRKAVSLKEQVLILYDFLEDIRLAERLLDLAEKYDQAGDNRSAQILNQLWEILLSAMEQMHDVLGNTHWETEQFIRLFRLLLSQYKVGTIPPVLDAVQMGPVSAMRCHQEKHLIILGAQEGSLPGYAGSSGVLTDQERVTLREMGVPLTGGAMEGIQAEFAEIYGVFCGAKDSISVYCSGEQPSYIFRRLAEMAGEEEKVQNLYDFAQADPMEAGIFLAGWKAEDSARRIGILEQYMLAGSQIDYRMGKVEPENISRLYGSTLNLSASQIDRQAECRLSYFLKYGLRAQERKEVTLDPAEFGTYVHAVLENTVRCIRDMGGFREVSFEETLEIAHKFSDEYARERFSQISSDRMTYLFQRNMQELDMIVRELWEELRESLFEPREFELDFGDGGSLPPICIPNRKLNALLRGFVDRIDVWKSHGIHYYRVVDYKTGRKDFDYCDVFNGVGLQMLLYMFALKDSGEGFLGEKTIAAGVQYFPARAPYILTDGKVEDEEASKARQSHWKRKGLLLHDEQVLQAMEPGDAPVRMNYTKNKDGELSGDLADLEQMKLLEKYVFRVVAEMVEDIASGNVEPNPYTRGTSHNACAFCPYGSVCHEKSVEGRRNYKAMKSQEFWERIRKELDGYGR